MFRRLGQIAAFAAGLLGPLAAVPALAADTSDTVEVTIAIEPFAEVEVPGGLTFTLRVPKIDYCSYAHSYHRWKYGWNHINGWRNFYDDWDWDEGWFASNWKKCYPWLSYWYWPTVRPTRIPYTVTGNALASVSVKPHQFLRISTGRYMGKATGPGGATLGYGIVNHFPAPNWSYSWRPGWDAYEDWIYWRGWGGFGYLPYWSRYAFLPGLNNVGTPFLSANMVQRGGSAAGVIYVVSRRDFTADGKKARPGDYTGILEITIVADNL